MSVCKICSQELTITLDPEEYLPTPMKPPKSIKVLSFYSFNEATSSAVGGSVQDVPDDLLLSCGCHFHWQCLLDESAHLAVSLGCPSCQVPISTAGTGDSAPPHIFTRYHNEGGVQERLDIFALVKEEAYLDANPKARPARAFLTMCGEGDVAGIVELVHAIQEEADEGDMTPAELLRYQDPLDNMNTGLHLAVQNPNAVETVWLLLWLVSELPISEFPQAVSQAAMAMGAGRETVQGGRDIRAIRDEQGRTPGDVASAVGTTWSGVLYNL